MSFINSKMTIESELSNLLTLEQSRPYVFRTRLERAMERTLHFASDSSKQDIVNYCNQIKEKINYISDQSNQTSDGTLKSFIFLEGDIKSLLKQVQKA